MLSEFFLTSHVGGERSVRSPAGVPAHNFTPGHQGALVCSTTYKTHRPNRHTSSTAHLQRKKRKTSLNKQVLSCFYKSQTPQTSQNVERKCRKRIPKDCLEPPLQEQRSPFVFRDVGQPADPGQKIQATYL